MDDSEQYAADMRTKDILDAIKDLAAEVRRVKDIVSVSDSDLTRTKALVEQIALSIGIRPDA
jgi:hypothetical protein